MKLSPPTRASESLASRGGGLAGAPAGPGRDARRRLGLRGWFLLLVLLPTLAVGVYFYGFAANIYESEARFVVRNRGSGQANPMAEIAGASRMASLFPATRTGSEEGRAVVAYVDSHAAVAALKGSLDLVDLWRRPEADLIARLWWDQPQAEWLLWYYRRRVRMVLDPDTGVMILRAQAFRPEDAQTLSRALLALSERLVITLSERGSADALRTGEEDLARAEARVAAAREALIAFREREQAFDPARAAAGAVETIGRLEGALAQARTELQERQAFMRPDNPQVQVLRNRIEALQAQIAAERGRMTRGGEAMTQQVASYERLELERSLADRQLASATASLEAARTEAIRQQTFVLRVAEPHLPEAALYPRAAYNTLTVFVSLAMLFGVGWLLIVSAREHAN
ncbi:MAG: capsule biosynthesis protein [Roseomonas sp.]|nr:capsule biosynthesis protein [Roseomonas sp.]